MVENKLSQPPISVGAAAVYPYSEELLAECERTSKYEDEPYNLARVVGPEQHRRIWVPRNMAPEIVNDMRVDGLSCNFNSSFIPRNEEQTRVIEETVALLEDGYNFMMEAPTGFGKTWCACDIIAKVGVKTIIVVTKEDIRDQWVVALEKLLGLKVGKDIGFIQGDVCKTVGCRVVIAFIQSVAKEQRYPASVFSDFGLAIWDECIAEGSKILMGDGVSTIPIEILAENFITKGLNPSVMSFNERNGFWQPRRITNAWKSGVRKIVEVCLDDGKSIRCTADHLLLTTNRGWVAAGDLTSDDDLVIY